MCCSASPDFCVVILVSVASREHPGSSAIASELLLDAVKVLSGLATGNTSVPQIFH
jgi:hypothetical protein